MSEEIEYRLRRSTRARRARVIVTQEGGVEVVLPRGMAVRHVAPLLAEKRRWIERLAALRGGTRGRAHTARGRWGGSVPG